MKKYIKSIVSLTVICAVVAVLLGITNAITAPIIKKQGDKAVQDALKEVLPNGEGFESVMNELAAIDFTVPITEAYKEKNGGYVFKIETTGYASGLHIICGINKDGVVEGTKCVASSETNGAEKTYGDRLKGKTIEDIETVDTVAGSTKTTRAYKEAVKVALDCFSFLNGGTVDFRSEEQILADNLKAALPSADGFYEVFICEDIEGLTEVYGSDNDSGFVYVFGEEFFAVDKSGNVLTEAVQENKDKVLSAHQKINNCHVNELDISKYSNLPLSIENIGKTDSGNYVINVKANGYGILGKYHNSGENIKIKLSITPGGKIIYCKTEFQSESENYGAACENKTFYSQFNGKTETDYSDIDGISGATVTTDGYKNAIADVFEAVKILEGES